MKIKALSAAVAMAFAGSASAIEVHNGGTVDFVMNLSGATASTKTMRDIIKDDICASDVDVYNADKHWVVACVVDSKYNVGAGPTSVLFRKADDGSSSGVKQLDESLPVPMTQPDGTCTGGPDEWTCTSGRVSIADSDIPNGVVDTVPDVGTSDVEPAMFVGSLADKAGDFVNASGVSVSPLAGLAFGVVATTSLRDALQNMQFPTKASWTTDERESEEYMPSLSSSVLRSLFSGRVGLWAALKNGAGANLLAFNSAGVTPPASPVVHICRREQGSGTHATIAAEILRTNCAAGATASMVSLAGGLSHLTAPSVTETNGSGDMSNCLNAAESGTAVPGSFEGSTMPAGKRWALGYQSVEKGALFVDGGVAKSSEKPANLADGFRFIKIDGVAPTLDNIHRGDYPIFSQSTIQIRGGSDGKPVWNDSIVAAGAESQAMMMYTDIASILGEASKLVSVNAGSKFDHSWKNPQGGWLADPNNTLNNADLVLNINNPVNSFARAGGNTCQDPVSPTASFLPGKGLRIAD